MPRSNDTTIGAAGHVAGDQAAGDHHDVDAEATRGPDETTVLGRFERPDTTHQASRCPGRERARRSAQRPPTVGGDLGELVEQAADLLRGRHEPGVASGGRHQPHQLLSVGRHLQDAGGRGHGPFERSLVVGGSADVEEHRGSVLPRLVELAHHG